MYHIVIMRVNGLQMHAILSTLFLVSSTMAIRFVKEPQDTSVAQGDEGILNCVFDRPVSSCYWNKDGSNVEIGNGRYQWAQRSSSGSSSSPDCTLKISGAHLKLDDGTWECGTPQTDQAEGIHSGKANFTVLHPPGEPAILLNGVEQTNETGIPVDIRVPPKITCVSNNGNPPAILSWQLDGTSAVTGELTFTNTSNPKIKRVELNITRPAIDASWTDRRLICNSQHPSYSTGEQHYTYVYIKIPYATTTATALSGNGSSSLNFALDNTEWVALNCSADGFPPPQFRWERREDEKAQWQFFRDGQNITFQAFTSQFQCVVSNDNYITKIRSQQIIAVHTNSSRGANIGLIIGIIIIVLILIVLLVAGVFTLYKKKKWPFFVPPRESRNNAPENNALAHEATAESGQLQAIPENVPAEQKHLMKEEPATNGAKRVDIIRNFINPHTIHGSAKRNTSPTPNDSKAGDDQPPEVVYTQLRFDGTSPRPPINNNGTEYATIKIQPATKPAD